MKPRRIQLKRTRGWRMPPNPRRKRINQKFYNRLEARNEKTRIEF